MRRMQLAVVHPRLGIIVFGKGSTAIRGLTMLPPRNANRDEVCMSLRVLVMKFMIIVVIVIGIAVVYDLVLWKQTRDRIDKISSLAGMPVAEAIAYLEENRKPLRIESVRQYQEADGEWLVVKLKKVSFLGVVLSWCCNDKLASLEISGMLRLAVEDDRITTSQIVF